MRDTRHAYLFVANRPGHALGFRAHLPAQTRAKRAPFPARLNGHGAARLKITRVLTDTGKAFTDRLFGWRKRKPHRGARVFRPPLCADLSAGDAPHDPPIAPADKTALSGSGFNGRIMRTVLQRPPPSTGGEDWNTHPGAATSRLYNGQLPQSCATAGPPMRRDEGLAAPENRPRSERPAR